MPDDAAIVTAFLADRHVACPACGYDLCGGRRVDCPECGCRFRLTLERADLPPPGRAEWSGAFAIVLFGAVLSAISWALSAAVGGMPLTEVGPWVLLAVPLIQLLAALHLLRHLRRVPRFSAPSSPAGS